MKDETLAVTTHSIKLQKFKSLNPVFNLICRLLCVLLPSEWFCLSYFVAIGDCLDRGGVGLLPFFEFGVFSPQPSNVPWCLASVVTNLVRRRSLGAIYKLEISSPTAPRNDNEVIFPDYLWINGYLHQFSVLSRKQDFLSDRVPILEGI